MASFGGGGSEDYPSPDATSELVKKVKEIDISGTTSSGSNSSEQCIFSFDFKATAAMSSLVVDSLKEVKPPKIWFGVDLHSLVFIERHGKYYVTVRSAVTKDSPTAFKLFQVRVPAGVMDIGFDSKVAPSPCYTVGFIEGVFRHFMGLEMVENPSTAEMVSASVRGLAAQTGGHHLFGAFAVGQVSFETVRDMLAPSTATVKSLAKDKTTILIDSTRPVGFASSQEKLLDQLQSRYLFRRINIKNPKQTGRTAEFVFIDASVFNGSIEETGPFLESLARKMRDNPQPKSKIVNKRPIIYQFFDRLASDLSGPESTATSSWFQLVKSISSVTGAGEQETELYLIELKTKK